MFAWVLGLVGAAVLRSLFGVTLLLFNVIIKIKYSSSSGPSGEVRRKVRVSNVLAGAMRGNARVGCPARVAPFLALEGSLAFRKSTIYGDVGKSCGCDTSGKRFGVRNLVTARLKYASPRRRTRAVCLSCFEGVSSFGRSERGIEFCFKRGDCLRCGSVSRGG